jgi:hypothetical protein
MRAPTLVVVTALALVVPKASVAETFVVEACKTANGPAPITSWSVAPIPADVNNPPELVSDACRSGGVAEFDVAMFTDGLRGLRWSFRPPAGTTVAAVSLTRYAGDISGNSALRRYRLRAGEQLLEQSPQEPTWVLDEHEYVATGLRAPGIDLEFTCEGETETCGSDGARLWVRRAAVTVRDEFPPELTALPTGRLTLGRAQDGIVDLKLDFKDVGGGVQAIEYKVDGLTRFVEPVGGAWCKQPYVVATPCATEGHVTLMLDTDELSDGPHTVEAVLVDAADNRTIAGPFGISVRTPPPAPPVVGSGGIQPPTLAEALPVGVLSVTGSRSRRASYREAVVLNGVVKAPNGAALSGAPVALNSRPLISQAWSAPTTTTADAQGRFELAVPPGPSRELRLSYGSSVQIVRLVVRAPVRLKTNRKRTRNGRSIRFEGSVPGAGTATARVELQARAGRKWVPFRTTALKNGKFKASYRFTSTYSKTRYRFRAVVHEDSDFPYASGKSPTVSVVVAP